MGAFPLPPKVFHTHETYQYKSSTTSHLYNSSDDCDNTTVSIVASPNTKRGGGITVPRQGGDADLGALFDGANDSSSRVNQQTQYTANKALVDAVSESVLRQLRQANAAPRHGHKGDCSHALQSGSGQRLQPWTEPEAIGQLTRQAKAPHECYPAATANSKAGPRPSKSQSTLKTVSALLPYRSEFQKAGLAVTSKDQAASRIPSYITKAVAARTNTTTTKKARARFNKIAKTQVDGFEDTEESETPNTEMDFANAEDMDEWRYALVDELPKDNKAKKERSKAKSKKGKSKKTCLPCFRGRDDSSTTAGTSQRVHPKASLPSHLRSGIGPPPREPPPRPPRPPVGLFDSPPKAIAAGKPTIMSPISQLTSNAISPRMLPRRNLVESRQKPRLDNFPTIPDPVVSKQFARDIRVPAGSNFSSDGDAKQLAKETECEPKGKAPRRSRKKSTRTATKKTLHFEPDHIGICCRSNRGIPSRANARPNIPRRTSSMSKLLATSSLDYDDAEITDRDVLRGLHIAASAACDEEVDAYVRNKTGLRIRRFLADLIALETLGEPQPGEDQEQWAKRRRAEMRKLKQQLRRSREINAAIAERLS